MLMTVSVGVPSAANACPSSIDKETAGTQLLPFASSRAVPNVPLKFPLALLKMMTATAPASCALLTLLAKLLSPRATSAMFPETAAGKSPGLKPF